MELAGLQARRAELGETESSLYKAKAGWTSMASSAAAAGAVMTVAYGSIVAAASGLVNKVSEEATMVRVASQAAGMSAEQYEKYAYAAKMCQVNQDTFNASLSKMTAYLGAAKAGGKSQMKVFEQLGLTPEQIAKMNPDQAFAAIENGLHNVHDLAVRADLNKAIFGRGGSSMLVMAKLSQQQLAGLGNEAVKWGAVMNEQTYARVMAYQQEKTKFATFINSVQIGLGQKLMPALTQAMGQAMSLLDQYRPQILQFAQNFGQFIVAATPVFIKMISYAGGLAMKLANIAVYIGTHKAAMIALSTVVVGYLALSLLSNLYLTGKAFLEMAGNASKATAAMSGFNVVSLLETGYLRALYIWDGIVAAATKAWAVMQGLLDVAMDANPIGALIVAAVTLAGIALAIYDNWSKVKSLFESMDNKGINTGIGRFPHMVSSGGNGSNGGSKKTIILKPTYNVYGGNASEVQSGVEKSHSSLLSKLQSIQSQEARTSFG
jgi:hypothetical protein